MIILGCGKSALVQAVSKNTNLPIIRVVPSLLLRKYIGESSAMTKAIFTAAKKLQPCIIFIDEMDALFRTRNDHENSIHNRELMTECTYVHTHTFIYTCNDYLFLHEHFIVGMYFYVCMYVCMYVCVCLSMNSFICNCIEY